MIGIVYVCKLREFEIIIRVFLIIIGNIRLNGIVILFNYEFIFIFFKW